MVKCLYRYSQIKMKKELALHILTTLLLLIPIFLLRYLNINNWPFFVGGLIGAILPDIDHIIYVYYLHPYEVTSQRVMYEAKKGNLQKTWDVLSSTRTERTNLILHTVTFQVFFLILSFLVVTSSGSILGKGLVLAFLLHLFVDEIIDLKETGTLANWFRQVPIQLDKMQLNIYLLANFIIILIFGLVM
jgi:hypothetical protein